MPLPCEVPFALPRSSADEFSMELAMPNPPRSSSLFHPHLLSHQEIASVFHFVVQLCCTPVYFLGMKNEISCVPLPG